MAKFKASPILCTIFQILSAFVLPSLSAPQSGLVTQIPGFSGTFPSNHYSGYVSIDEKNGKSCFTISLSLKGIHQRIQLSFGSTVDLVALALMDEHGPFNFEAANASGSLPKLHLNPYSWSKVSSVLYLDSPVGVGLSYSKNTSDYITSDVKTAQDSYTFLLKWFELYPEFLSNPFYISGESYAGIYVPTLSFEVMKGIDAGIFNRERIYRYWAVNTACKGKFYEPLNDICERNLAKVYKNLEALNKYAILEPCYHGKDTRGDTSDTMLQLPSSGETDRPFPVRKRMFGRAWPLRAPVREGIVPTWPQLLKNGGLQCIDDRIATLWLSNEAVRKAIHADDIRETGAWELCTDRISLSHDAGYSMIKYHWILTAKGYRALIFWFISKKLALLNFVDNELIHFDELYHEVSKVSNNQLKYQYEDERFVLFFSPKRGLRF